jgi:uroporphyrinogen-III synthase
MIRSALAERLDGWQVLALRPARDCAALRRALQTRGARLHCLAPWRIQLLADQRASLQHALRLPLWLVTSPNAVRGAAALCPLRDFAGLALAVGPGTALALRRAGVARVSHPPGRHDSEGLLAMPELAAVDSLALLSGEGGRGLLDRTLAERGIAVQRIDVYRRVPRRIANGTLQRLQALPTPKVVWLSSFEALRGGGPRLTDVLTAGFELIAASERIAALAGELQLPVVAIAGSAAPAALLAALQRHAKQRPIR